MTQEMIQYIARAVVLLVGLPVHELAHGYIAYRLGDPTAKQAGRLTLNPFKHLDLLGTLAMILVGIGWAKPVPINSYYFKNPKRDIAIVSFAGPLSNLIMAFLSMIFYKITLYMYYTSSGSQVMFFFATFFQVAVLLNVVLAVFNLIPVPPSDGSKILGLVLPDRIYYQMLKFERYGFIIIVLLVMSGFLSKPMSFVSGLIMQGMGALTFFVDVIMKMFIG